VTANVHHDHEDHEDHEDHDRDDLFEMLESAWGIICNASNRTIDEGGPVDASPGWQQAAQRWRDRYHELLRSRYPAPHHEDHGTVVISLPDTSHLTEVIARLTEVTPPPPSPAAAPSPPVAGDGRRVRAQRVKVAPWQPHAGTADRPHYKYFGAANGHVVYFYTADPELELYVRPIVTSTTIGVALIDANNVAYATQVTATHAPALGVDDDDEPDADVRIEVLKHHYFRDEASRCHCGAGFDDDDADPIVAYARHVVSVLDDVEFDAKLRPEHDPTDYDDRDEDV
jgi:hypothetical protein